MESEMIEEMAKVMAGCNTTCDKCFEQLENGTLLFIPCKVGDKFYGIQGNHYFKYEVRAIVITRHEIWLETVYEMRFLYGEEAFLTEEETEKKLKELQE